MVKRMLGERWFQMDSKKIVIVDDEPRTREGLKRTLENWSKGQFELTCLDNGESAIEHVKTHPGHLVITDVRMPKMTGLELIEQIKQQKIQTAIIVISAYSEFEYAQEALRHGVVRYLLKPIGKKRFIKAVEEALKRQEEQDKSVLMAKIIDEDLIDIHGKDAFARGISESLDYIEEHYHEEISLQKVADAVHLNPSYLSTLFKDELKLSFTQYLTKVRIRRAKHLLITTDLHVTEIAEQVGYSTAKYFNKVFKEYVGETPSAFRKANVNAF